MLNVSTGAKLGFFEGSTVGDRDGPSLLVGTPKGEGKGVVLGTFEGGMEGDGAKGFLVGKGVGLLV
jgi:hypothetical protein